MHRLLPDKGHQDVPVGGPDIPETLTYRREIGESSVLVKTDLPEAAEAAFQTIANNRAQLERYLRAYPEFLLSLDPLRVDKDAPEIVLRMSQAAERANVGPMAAVAGALADLAAEDMSRQGAKTSIVENGGEISIRSEVKVDVAIYSGESPISGRLGFRILPQELPLGLATSSGTVGHALSFGLADSATVIADDAALADAAATAVCNAVQAEDLESSIESGLNVARTIQGVRGALIVRGPNVGTVGHLPQLIGVDLFSRYESH